MASKKIIKNFGIIGFGLCLAFSAFAVTNNQKVEIAKAEDAIDYSATYTSNITLSTSDGTGLTSTEANYGGKTFDCLKAGTSSKAGEVIITVPANTIKVHFHAAGWNKESITITAYIGNSTTGKAFKLTSDAGVSGNGDFALKNVPSTSSYFSLDLDSTNSETTIRFKATSGNRFAFFGVNAEIEAEQVCAHENLAPTSSMDPTCVVAGHKEYYQCDDCGVYFEDNAHEIEIGDANALNNWMNVGGNGYIAPNSNHVMSEVDYDWDGDYCLAMTHCTVKDCKYSVEEDGTGTYVKDTDATCTENEKGHYEMTFTNPLLGTISTEANSVEVPSSTTACNIVGESFVWSEDNLTCTATKGCSNPDCPNHIAETVESVSTIIDAATCASGSNVSYKATFEGGFTEQEKAVTLNDALPHEYRVAIKENGKNCDVKITCANCDYVYEATVEGEFVQDTPATCLNDAKGHYVYTFDHPAIRQHFGQKNTVELPDSATGHNITEYPIYTWDGEYCTATYGCTNPGCSEVETETVKGEYNIKTYATCEKNEVGYYTATFEKDLFNQWFTERSFKQIEIADSVLGHDIEIFYSEIGTTSVSAFATCKRNGCNYYITETADANLVIDVPASCEKGAVGHLEADFNNEIFGHYVGNSVSVSSELKHDFQLDSVTFQPDGSYCTVKVCCSREGCETTEYLYMTPTYVKDSDATCTENEKGHYEATFNDPYFSGTVKSDDCSVEKPFTAIGHKWDQPTYVWDGENCTATCKCKNEGCNETLTETVKGEYLAVKDATCTENEKGNMYASFTNSKLGTTGYATEIQGSAKGHSYSHSPSYIWNGQNCTAILYCDVCNAPISETVTATYEKTIDATCTENEKGYYIASFTNPLFKTELSKEFSVPNTATGHSFTDIKVENVGYLECTGTCSRCNQQLNFVKNDKTYIIDQERTCTENEKGHYKYLFTTINYEYEEKAGSIENENTALGHLYGDASYTWSGNELTAECSCTREGCSHKETDKVTGVYVKDTDATCTENEKGHYEATFTNSLFTKQSTEANSEEKENTATGHNYGSPTYVWNNDKCTASASCTGKGCSESISETVTGVYVKDTDATVDSNEKGHLEATFTNSKFVVAKTDANSVEIPDTKLPEEKGCSSSLIASSAIVSTLTILGACLLTKKRKEF